MKVIKDKPDSPIAAVTKEKAEAHGISIIAFKQGCAAVKDGEIIAFGGWPFEARWNALKKLDNG